MIFLLSNYSLLIYNLSMIIRKAFVLTTSAFSGPTTVSGTHLAHSEQTMKEFALEQFNKRLTMVPGLGDP